MGCERSVRVPMLRELRNKAMMSESRQTTDLGVNNPRCCRSSSPEAVFFFSSHHDAACCRPLASDVNSNLSLSATSSRPYSKAPSRGDFFFLNYSERTDWRLLEAGARLHSDSLSILHGGGQISLYRSGSYVGTSIKQQACCLVS